VPAARTTRAHRGAHRDARDDAWLRIDCAHGAARTRVVVDIVAGAM
jgi:hypothetical protein